MNTDDRQVPQFLAQFTLLPMDEVNAVSEAHLADPGRREGQRRLARESDCSGPRPRGGGRSRGSISDPLRCSGVGIGPMPWRRWPARCRVVEVRASELSIGVDLIDALSRPGSLAASKGEARRSLEQGGVYVNGERVEVGATLVDDHLLHSRYVVLRRGKRSVALVQVVP